MDQEDWFTKKINWSVLFELPTSSQDFVENGFIGKKSK